MGFNCVGALILQLVSAQLVEQTDSAASLVLVDEDSPVLSRDALQSQLQLRPAIAAQAMEDVSGETLRVDPQHRRRVAGQGSSGQNHCLLHGRIVNNAVESKDP